jgi:hypothetical protein
MVSECYVDSIMEGQFMETLLAAQETPDSFTLVWPTHSSPWELAIHGTQMLWHHQDSRHIISNDSILW